jgi:uncharacterized membrane protein YwaF
MFAIEPLNLTWFATMLVFVAAIVFIRMLLKGKTDKAKRDFLVFVSIVNILLFFIYKFYLATELSEYGYSFFDMVPLHLCNINIILLPIALALNTRQVLSYLFYVAPLVAFLALITPLEGFSGESLFLMKNLGYYLTHGLIFIIGISLVTLDIIVLRYRDVLWCIVVLLALTFVVFGINSILNVTIYPEANYFYTQSPDVGVPQLEWLWGLIPIPFVYLLPIMIFAVPYALFITWVVRRVTRH